MCGGETIQWGRGPDVGRTECTARHSTQCAASSWHTPPGVGGVRFAVVAELEGLAKAPPPLCDHARVALATLQHAFDAKHPYALHGRCLC